MFLTSEQVQQLQILCEHVAGSHTRSGEITIEIKNNMARTFREMLPVYDGDHNLIGYTIQIHRVILPVSEFEKHRQKNRLKPNNT